MSDTQGLVVKIGDEKLTADARTFKSGSTGYWAGGKVTLAGARYQVSVSIVKIGSKPAQA